MLRMFLVASLRQTDSSILHYVSMKRSVFGRLRRSRWIGCDYLTDRCIKGFPLPVDESIFEFEYVDRPRSLNLQLGHSDLRLLVNRKTSLQARLHISD